MSLDPWSDEEEDPQETNRVLLMKRFHHMSLDPWGDKEEYPQETNRALMMKRFQAVHAELIKRHTTINNETTSHRPSKKKIVQGKEKGNICLKTPELE